PRRAPDVPGHAGGCNRPLAAINKFVGKGRAYHDESGRINVDGVTIKSTDDTKTPRRYRTAPAGLAETMRPSIRRTIRESRLARFLPRVLPYLKPYWGLALVTALVYALMTVIGLLEPWPLKILVDSSLQDHPLPAVVNRFAGGLASNRMAILLFAVGAQFGLTVLSNAA